MEINCEMKLHKTSYKKIHLLYTEHREIGKVQLLAHRYYMSNTRCMGRYNFSEEDFWIIKHGKVGASVALVLTSSHATKFM